ncbi:hypothetical protein EVAR_64757_1 [Eumeta japonica]|uniref:Uncharacterized protein n=1 Tax=Eumeta variegata TaxID=151549 RepID=A0A4C1ZEW6_EUMVA|nr:hypothetical protein EVAR_64757_1 [Eumeta japonica]
MADGWLEGEEESGALRERELRSLHRTVPALRRRELDTRAIKHHFYPEGGWGICPDFKRIGTVSGIGIKSGAGNKIKSQEQRQN